MQIKRVTVKPEKDGTVKLRIEGLDDAGHYLTYSIDSPSVQAVTDTVQKAFRHLSVVASEKTEEEEFTSKTKKVDIT